MKRKIECRVCGHQHSVTINNHKNWFAIKKACCPVCCKDLPPDSDEVWDDENYWQAAATEHRPVEE